MEMSSNRNFVNAVQVQSTNDASIVSKCSMAKNNYVKDNFVENFVEKQKPRASLIHLGYYARAVIISRILVQFIKFLQLKKILKFQIISCGAGFDTTYWRLSEEGLINENCTFVEIDYADVVKRKIKLICDSENLKSYLKIPEMREHSCINRLSSNYILLCADLCHLSTVEDLLKSIDIDFNAPTLFLSECVITYMKVKDSDRLLKWMSKKFGNCMFLNYEQIHPEDSFGNVMLRHFDKLQSTLHSVLTYPDCDSHRRRYQSLGFEKSVVASEWDFLLQSTDEKERKRVLNLEQFDEFEEFHLKCSHYVIGVALKNLFCEWNSQINVFRTPYDYNNVACGISNFKMESKNMRFELYGHVVCGVNQNTALIFGGYRQGGRSKKVYKYNNDNIEEIEISGYGYASRIVVYGAQFMVIKKLEERFKKPYESHTIVCQIWGGGGDEKNIRFDAIHGCAASCTIKDKTFVGVYGGRTSPNHIINKGGFILLEYNDQKLTVRSFSDETIPAGRYRSTMVCQPYGSRGISFWIFGGRTVDLKDTLPDFWQLLVQWEEEFTYKWIKRENEVAPCCRMSHSAAISPEDGMYVTCGLDGRDFSVLNDIWKWSFVTESWEKIEPRNRSLIPRYGHTSHILQRNLYLIGGVNTIAGYQPGLAIFNLDTFHLQEFSVEPFLVEPILLFNHSTIIPDDDGDGVVVVFGGGGNCFSFGTYFNKNVHTIPLKQFKSCAGS